MAVHYNVDGHGHGPLDFHAPTKDLWPGSACHRRIHTGWRLKSSNQCWFTTPSLVSGRSMSVGGHGSEKIRVASLTHTNPTPPMFHLHLGGFVLLHTWIWWVSSLHGTSPLDHQTKHGQVIECIVSITLGRIHMINIIITPLIQHQYMVGATRWEGICILGSSLEQKLSHFHNHYIR